MLCGFTADKSRTRLNASLRNAANDSRYLLGNILSASYVIKEKQRSCSATDNIVNAHSHRVYSYGIVLVHKYRHLYLSSATVCSRYENGVLNSERKSEAASKSSNVIKASLVFSSRDMSLHKLNRLIAGGYINACRLIAFTVAFHFCS